VLRDFQPTLFFSVPTLYARLLRADLPPATFRSVRLCVSAGERLPAELYTAWEQRFGVPILDGIGATETVFMFLSNRPDQRRAGSSGLPVPGSEARILDAEGREVPTGEQGVLWVKTPSAAAGYWNRLDLTRQTFVGEWYRTRDVYVRDADGFYYHRGREDDWFKVAAMWVNPVDVEQACLEHPGVLEAGVVGAEDEGGLVKPFLFVLPRDPTAEAEPLVRELEAWLGQRLASHQRPKRIVVVPELPRTATGKLQRFQLREQVRRLLQPHPESSALQPGTGDRG
jgi:acyl-coenzyme A synthetase/AMP-(fatty) acid ligase